MTQTGNHSLINAFKQTDYYVYADDTWHRVNIGGPCPEALRDWFRMHCHGPCAWIITAYNPDAEQVNEDANKHYDNALKSWLDSNGHAYAPSDSHAQAGDWPSEPGVCLLDTDEGLVRQLALRFEQTAMVAVPIDGDVQIVWA